MDTRQDNKRPSGTRKPAADGVKKRPVASRGKTEEKTRRVPVKAAREKAAPTKRPVKKAAPKRRAPEKRPVREERNAYAPEVVYTPPQPFNRRKLLLHLCTVIAVVLAFSFGISVFFRVENITVSGTVKYDAWTIKEASGIEIGDNLLSFGEARAAGKIRAALPYVESVRIGIKLPNTVNIEIKELDVVYSIQDSEYQWWLITAEGRVVEKTDKATAQQGTVIEGLRLASPVVGQQAVAWEGEIETPSDPTETMPAVTVRASDQLRAALNILQHLEECGIIGEVASVNVTDLGNLQLWYGSRFQVMLGDTTQLLYKIKCMNAAINGTDPYNSLKEYDSGVLDITFTVKPNDVIYQAATD